MTRCAHKVETGEQVCNIGKSGNESRFCRETGRRRHTNIWTHGQVLTMYTHRQHAHLHLFTCWCSMYMHIFSQECDRGFVHDFGVGVAHFWACACTPSRFITVFCGRLLTTLDRHMHTHASTHVCLETCAGDKRTLTLSKHTAQNTKTRCLKHRSVHDLLRYQRQMQGSMHWVVDEKVLPQPAPHTLCTFSTFLCWSGLGLIVPCPFHTV